MASMYQSEYDEEFEASLRRLDEQQFREQQAVSQELARFTHSSIRNRH